MILVVLQVRVSSSRLPGKALKPILGKPMIFRQIERIKRSRKLNKLIVATSLDPSDNAIEEMCVKNNILCFRGDLNDVLDRFYQAAKIYKPNHVVRLTGDCPLVDPCLIDKIIEFHLEDDYDYSSNTIEPTYPDGLDVEVMRFSSLEGAWREAKLPSQREHVTPFLYSQPERYKLGSFKNKVDLSNLRWTVDEEGDFELITKIYQALYSVNPSFLTNDILAFLEKNPDLKKYNTRYKRNEGYQKSLERENILNEEKGS